MYNEIHEEYYELVEERYTLWREVSHQSDGYQRSDEVFRRPRMLIPSTAT